MKKSTFFVAVIFCVFAGLVMTGCSKEDEPEIKPDSEGVSCTALFKCDDPRADLFTTREFWNNSINVGAEGGEFEFTLSNDLSDFNKTVGKTIYPLSNAYFFHNRCYEYYDPEFKAKSEALGEVINSDVRYRNLEWEMAEGFLPKSFNRSQESVERLCTENGGHESPLMFGSMVWGHNKFTLKVAPNDTEVPRSFRIDVEMYFDSDEVSELKEAYSLSNYKFLSIWPIYIFQDVRK